MNAIERPPTAYAAMPLSISTSAVDGSSPADSSSNDSTTGSFGSNSSGVSSANSSKAGSSTGHVLRDITAAVVCAQHHHQQQQQNGDDSVLAAVAVVPSDPMECNTADMDPTMCSDPRIIVNLLATERATMPTCDYFRHVQHDILPFMRKVVTTWMLEVGFLDYSEWIIRVHGVLVIFVT